MSISITDVLIFAAVVVGGIAIASLSNWIQNRNGKGNGRDTTTNQR